MVGRAVPWFACGRAVPSACPWLACRRSCLVRFVVPACAGVGVGAWPGGVPWPVNPRWSRSVVRVPSPRVRWPWRPCGPCWRLAGVSRSGVPWAWTAWSFRRCWPRAVRRRCPCSRSVASALAVGRWASGVARRSRRCRLPCGLVRRSRGGLVVRRRCRCGFGCSVAPWRRVRWPWAAGLVRVRSSSLPVGRPFRLARGRSRRGACVPVCPWSCSPLARRASRGRVRRGRVSRARSLLPLRRACGHWRVGGCRLAFRRLRLSLRGVWVRLVKPGNPYFALA